MDVIGISDDDQASVLQIVAGVLHLGNISFSEQGNYAVPSDDECMYFSSFCICKTSSTLVLVKFNKFYFLSCWLLHLCYLSANTWQTAKKVKYSLSLGQPVARMY